ncbi:hypothetical protein ACIPM0_08850 [Pseudomonas sichuanensis]
MMAMDRLLQVLALQKQRLALPSRPGERLRRSKVFELDQRGVPTTL